MGRSTENYGGNSMGNSSISGASLTDSRTGSNSNLQGNMKNYQQMQGSYGAPGTPSNSSNPYSPAAGLKSSTSSYGEQPLSQSATGFGYNQSNNQGYGQNGAQMTTSNYVSGNSGYGRSNMPQSTYGQTGMSMTSSEMSRSHSSSGYTNSGPVQSPSAANQSKNFDNKGSQGMSSGYNFQTRKS